MSELELRAPRLGEVEALTDLINRAADELYGEREESVESTRKWLTGPTLDPETDIRVAVTDGKFRGYVDIDADPEPIYWVDLRVPLSEQDNVRVALMDWVERRAAERADGKADARLRAFAADIDEPYRRMLDARGLRAIRHFFRMRIELDEDVPVPDWPDGLTVRAAREADVVTVYEAHQEAFEDSWEHTRTSFEEWKHWLMGDEFDPSLWFLVKSGDEVAAVELCREHEGEAGLGWVHVLGVRRPWRRRGLGRAMLLHAFNEFRRRGFHAAALGVDAESITGANRLYENAGMSVVRQSAVYEKAL